MNRRARIILPDDRRAIRRALEEWARVDFQGMRTRALMALCLGSGLRLAEALKLNVAHVLERGAPKSSKQLGKLRSVCYLRPEDSKRGMGDGAFRLTDWTRTALRAYMREAIRRGWMAVGDDDAPLFVTQGGRGRGRLGKRAAQYSWKLAQKRAHIRDPYRFHDVRHDSLTRFSQAVHGDPFKVASFGRLRDIRTTQRYVHETAVLHPRYAEQAAADF